MDDTTKDAVEEMAFADAHNSNVSVFVGFESDRYGFSVSGIEID